MKEKGEEAWIFRMVGLCGLAFVVNAVLLLFVQWKEYPPFWLNEGGYPVWLRDLVFTTFYPMIILQFVVLGWASFYSLFAGSMGRSGRIVGLAIVLLLWLLFGSVLVILTWNNMDNLLNGRDLHYHPRAD